MVLAKLEMLDCHHTFYRHVMTRHSQVGFNGCFQLNYTIVAELTVFTQRYANTCVHILRKQVLYQRHTRMFHNINKCLDLF